jgi:hypothetical protein
MVDFRRQRKFITGSSILRVDAGLPPGRYRVRLTVADAEGNISRPALIDLVVAGGRRPPGR